AASSATRPCIDKSATTSRRSQRHRAARISRCSPRRSRAATATANFSSARDVVDKLVIDHLGHRGDGVALGSHEAIYVPYTLGGETVEVETVHGHPDRRRLLAIDVASPERITPFCPHFGVCGGCAIQHWRDDRYRGWKHQLVVETLRQAKLDCEVAPLVDAHGTGRRRITLHARMGTHGVLKVGFAAAQSHDVIPVDRCPILDPALNGALEAAWALAEALISVGKPRYPGDGHRERPRCRRARLRSTDGGDDRGAVADRGEALPGAADAAWRAGADAERTHPRHRPRAADLAAGLVPAGDGCRRRGACRAGGKACRPLQTHRRSLLRRRSVRTAARQALARERLRQRRRRGHGAAEGRDRDAGPQT